MHSIAGYGTKIERSHTGETQKASNASKTWNLMPITAGIIRLGLHAFEWVREQRNNSVLRNIQHVNCIYIQQPFVGVILEGFGEKDEYELVVEEDMEHLHVWTQHELTQVLRAI